MSFQAIRWAEQQKTGDAVSKAVLMAVAGFADKDGFAWPSQLAIAEKCELSVRAVRSAMKRLECSGLIVREKRGDRHGRGRTSDLILMGVEEKQNSNPPGFSGTKRRIYRHDVPRNLSGNHSNYPSHERDCRFQDVALGEDWDPDSNVVPFPLSRDVA